jgi:hypothetical protein
MAFHIVKNPNRLNALQNQAIEQPMGYAESFFSGAGETLGDILNSYAKNKAYEVGERLSSNPMSQKLQALNVPKAQADYLSTLPPQQQFQALQLLGSQQQPQTAQGMTESAKQEPNFLQQISKGAQATKRSPAEQSRINAGNKDYLNRLDKRAENAGLERSLAEEMLALDEEGDVESGLIASYKPISYLSDNSQRFKSASQELATALAARGGGPISKYRLQLSESIKAGLAHSKPARKKLLERILKEVEKVEKEDLLRHQIIEENGGEQPANIRSVMAKKMRELSDLVPITEEEVDILPPTEDYDDGAKIEDEETGVTYQLKSNQWWRVKE